MRVPSPPHKIITCIIPKSSVVSVEQVLPVVTSSGVRGAIEALVRQLHAESDIPPFVPGKTLVNYAGRVYDADELVALVNASLDFWLTAGEETAAFEGELAAVAGTRYAMMVNSGSSANLCALSALSSPKLRRPLVPGDEVITTAAAFPTTVNPIIQNGWVPVFVDVELATFDVPIQRLADALSNKTRAVVLTHTMGFPFDAAAVAEFCKTNGLYFIEDCCDALGASIAGRPVGTFGDLATLSFYPAHQITTGEGGAVLTSSGKMNWIARSFRDWGRDCWCEPGEDNACRKRFGFQLGTLPPGFDHKYTYAHIGYNLKALELQAAIGRVQLRKLPSFIEARRRNWTRLHEGLGVYSSYLLLPEIRQGTEPSPFGFVMTVKPEAPFSKAEITQWLEGRRIQTRGLFAGNLLRHPAYQRVTHRVVGGLWNSDAIAERTFFVGVYPGIDDERRDYVLDAFRAFFVERGLS
jgi:CDP-4-dehydro-6-deoxyglucose reductase, E1